MICGCRAVHSVVVRQCQLAPLSSSFNTATALSLRPPYSPAVMSHVHKSTAFLSLNVKKERIDLHETNPITALRGVTCHTRSHSVTCQVLPPDTSERARLNPSQ